MEQIKEETRANIIKVAMELFLECGIAGTSMQQIANGVHISHRTLYRYFEDKDELANTIALIQREQLEDIRHASMLKDGTGYARMEEHIAFLTHYQCMLSTLRISKFLAEYDYYAAFVARELRNDKLNALTIRYEQLIEKILLEGQADGSIRKNLDAAGSACMFVRIYITTIHQLASRHREDETDRPLKNRYIQTFFSHYLQSITTQPL